MRTLLSKALRDKLANDPQLGCGNFIHVAERINPFAGDVFFTMNEPVTTFLGETYDSFSLKDLKRVSDQYAAFYYGAGIREKDPVAVYLSEGISNIIHFIALTSIGAIPVMINGNMWPHIAAGFVAKVGARALFTDEEHSSDITPHLDPGLLFNVTDKEAATFTERRLPRVFPYVHDAQDPVLVGHSSGTTGIPKAVVFHHQQFFHGVRYRLSLDHLSGSERILSALPHSHSAGICYMMLAALVGSQAHIMTTNAAELLLPEMHAFKPTMVVAFPETYVGLSDTDLNRYDLSSIQLWFNGGDAAHEAHIRKLLSLGTRNVNGKKSPGSIFIDGMGSSEMGFSLFRNVHTPESNRYDRCVGAPIEWVDATVLDEEGNKLPPFEVGRLAVNAKTITPGYWNDSVLTARTRVHGYWLTGDMAYQDTEGRFYHVDRIPDVIRTAEGNCYSLQTEEILMKHNARIADCTVVGASTRKGWSQPIALVRLVPGKEVGKSQLLEELNAVLRENNRIPLADVVLADLSKFPVGPTGKVLKRELREHFKNYLVDGAPKQAVPLHA